VRRQLVPEKLPHSVAVVRVAHAGSEKEREEDSPAPSYDSGDQAKHPDHDERDADDSSHNRERDDDPGKDHKEAQSYENRAADQHDHDRNRRYDTTGDCGFSLGALKLRRRWDLKTAQRWTGLWVLQYLALVE
jgi:hypothetical protein